MLSIVLISLLGIGGTAALAIEVFDDDNYRPAPDTPGEPEEPVTGGPDPEPEEPEEPETGGPDPLPDDTDGLTAGTGGDAVLSLDGDPVVILPGLGADFTLDDVDLIDLTA